MELEPNEMRAVINRAKRAHGHLAKVIALMEEGDVDAAAHEAAAEAERAAS